MNLDPITFALDERNLAHVFVALALAGIADALDSAYPDSRCWWTDDGFKLQTKHTKEQLHDEAHEFAKSIAWIEGIGSDEKRAIKVSPHHGLFTAKNGHFGNPLLSYHDQGTTSSVFKTFAGNQGPAMPLIQQQKALKAPSQEADWLFQSDQGATSWKFDCRVASHAYDLGFGSNDDQSRDQDPIYPAIELLSIAGATFFAVPQAWLLYAESLAYCVWQTPVSVHLASLAATTLPSHPTKRNQTNRSEHAARYEIGCLLEGVDCRYYRVTPRGNSYGKGGSYKHFPEASLLTQPITK